jgi:hypothetical protein
MTKFITLIGVLLMYHCINAQLSIQQLNQTKEITFDQSIDGINNASFNGTGFSNEPLPGQLNSTGIIVQGTSDGNLNFGDTNTEGDFARGLSSGNKTTGGIYAFEVSDNNVALGIQPGGSDLTPGNIIVKILNNTGFDAQSIEIAYDIFELNNENRSCSVTFSTSSDNINYIHQSSVDYTTDEVKDENAQWKYQNHSTSQVIQLSNNSEYYLKFTIDDNEGNGSRDEIALDNISIRLNGTATFNHESTTSAFSIHPNPANSFIKINSQHSIDYIKIYNSAGVKVKQISKLTKENISVMDLKNGIYIIKTKFKNGTILARKLVIR